MCFAPFSSYEFCHSTVNAAVFNRRRTDGSSLDIANRPGQTISETWFRCFFALRLSNNIKQESKRRRIGQDLFLESTFVANKYIGESINNIWLIHNAIRNDSKLNAIFFYNCRRESLSKILYIQTYSSKLDSWIAARLLKVCPQTIWTQLPDVLHVHTRIMVK